MTLVTMASGLAGCFPLSNNLPVYLHYYETQAPGARSHGQGCQESGPPDEADFTIGSDPYFLQVTRPDWEHGKVSIVLTGVLSEGEDLQFDPRFMSVVDSATRQALEITGSELRRRNRDLSQTAIPLDRPLGLQGPDRKGALLRVWLVIKADVGTSQRFEVVFPAMTRSGHPVDFPEVTFAEKSGMFLIKPFC